MLHINLFENFAFNLLICIVSHYLFIFLLFLIFFSTIQKCCFFLHCEKEIQYRKFYLFIYLFIYLFSKVNKNTAKLFHSCLKTKYFSFNQIESAKILS